ncbi:SDR family oxidoreductase [Candidatus Woesearchaeota archaeon]|nr:SDR family oxidoreductase [Candidatus Woesearchaeota archaeon]
MSLAGKVALVTGGTRGIGRGTVEALAERDVSVIFTYHQASSEGYAREIEGVHRGKDVFGIHADVRDVDKAEEIVARVVRERGGLDILVNNAGIARVKEFDPNDPRAFVRDAQESYAANVVGAMAYTAFALPHMMQKGGDIFYISSVAEEIARNPEVPAVPFFMEPYTSTKGANAVHAEAMHKWALVALKGNVRFREIHPQLVLTDMGKELGGEFYKGLVRVNPGMLPEHVAPAMAGMTSSKRIWNPREIGDQLVYLAEHPEIKTVDQKLWSTGK